MGIFLRLTRGLLTAVGAFLILFGVGLALAKPQAEELFRRSTEAELSDAFGAPVTISQARLSLLRRAVRLDAVTVSNPAPFSRQPAFTCERVTVKLDPLSLFTRAPRIHRVEVQDAELDYRYKAGTGTNVRLLTQSVEQYAASHSGDREYQVALLEATGAKVTFSTNLVPLARVGMRVVDVRREDLTDSGPFTGIQIARIILLSVIREALTLNGLVDPVVSELKELFE